MGIEMGVEQNVLGGNRGGEVKVSVLVPICNVQRYLRQCLDSILDQTLSELQIICIDDGSTDRSPEILAEYAARDPRIEVITKPNSGYGDSMNKGLARARGKYVGIVESDDWVSVDMFADLYNLAEAHEAQVVKSSFYHYRTDGDGVGSDVMFHLFTPSMCDRVIDPAAEPEVFSRLACIWAAIYRRDFLSANEICFLTTPGASYQDTSFNFKVWACATRVWFTDAAYLHYRLDNEGSSVNSRGKAFYVADELHEIERFVGARQLNARLDGIVQQRKVDIYFWNLGRLSGGLARDFAALMTEEFKAAEEAGLFDYSLLKADELDKLQRFLKDPEPFINIDQVPGFSQRLKNLIVRIWYKISPSYRRQFFMRADIRYLYAQNEQLLLQLRQLVQKRDRQAAGRLVGQAAGQLVGQAAGQLVGQTAGQTQRAAGQLVGQAAGQTQRAAGQLAEPPGSQPPHQPPHQPEPLAGPLISIIVPVFNTGPYLSKCLDSLVGQSLIDIEIICVNDGSTDDSLAIMRAYAERDSRVIAIDQANSGVSTTRNTGLQQARAPYLMFCDSDDWFDPNMCRIMHDTLIEQQVDVVICGWKIIFEIPDELKQGVEEYLRLKYRGRRKIDWQQIINTDVSLCNKIYRREIIDRYQIDFPDGLLFEDAYFNDAYMTASETIYFLHQPLYNYLRHEKSVMSESFKKKGTAADYLQIAFRCYDYLHKHQLYEQFQDF
ncbi:MAG: glycosyltransferase, partial [Coriobacteriia bacterium]|nr:glycosyltransferase [Coriobacteriia bacterium]